MALEVIGKEIIDTDIRIQKEQTCPSLSGKSKLTYSIGCTPESDILIRINKNSGEGKFNGQWIGLDTILNLIDQAEKPFTWSVLVHTFKGQSVNTAGFIMAALKHEGLVQNLEGGGYERTRKDIKTLVKKPRSRKAK